MSKILSKIGKKKELLERKEKSKIGSGLSNEQAFKNCVVIGQKGEAALLVIAILPQGMFPKIIL